MDVKIPVPAGLIVFKDTKTIAKVKAAQVKAKDKVKDKAKVKRGRSARRKGHGFERDIAGEFRKVGYAQACRQLEYQQGLGVDIANVGIYMPQCKRGKSYASVSAIKEVPPKAGHIPLLITKADFEETLVVLPFSHFLELITKK